MHGNEIMNTLILNWNLVWVKSTSQGLWERTKGDGGWYKKFLFVQSTLFCTWCLWWQGDCARMCFASRTVSRISGSMSVYWLGGYGWADSDWNTFPLRALATSNPSPWVFKDIPFNRLCCRRHITGLPGDHGKLVWEAKKKVSDTAKTFKRAEAPIVKKLDGEQNVVLCQRKTAIHTAVVRFASQLKVTDTYTEGSVACSESQSAFSDRGHRGSDMTWPRWDYRVMLEPHFQNHWKSAALSSHCFIVPEALINECDPDWNVTH